MPTFSPPMHSPTRSALDDYPGGSVPRQPTVAVIVPVRNEREHVAEVVAAVLQQDYPALSEIWFVDGFSQDGTAAELRRLAAHDARVRVVDNPRRTQASAINEAMALLRADVVIRLDAHARYAPDVVSRSVAALLASGAGGVGAIARPLEASSLIARSIVAAHQSRLGVGVASFRRESPAGWVDTLWNGCYWRHVMDAAGPLREDLPRNEDNDFNARVRALGYGLYLEPAVRAYYVPRRSLAALWRQYFATGAGVGQTVISSRRSVSPRHLAPLVFVCGLAALLTALFSARLRPAALGALGLYGGALGAESVRTWARRPGLYAALLPLVFATLHVSYGLGTMYGLARALARRTESEPL